MPSEQDAEIDVQAELKKILTPKADPAAEAKPEPEAGEEAPQADAEDTSEGPKEDAPQEDFQMTLPQLAAALGADEAQLDVDEGGNAIFKTKIDGQEGYAKVSDLLKSYQLEGHLNKKNMEVAERAKALDAQKQQIEQQTQQKLQQINDMIQVGQQQLMLQFQGINWEQLKATNNAEYLRLRYEFDDAQKRIQQGFQFLQGQRQQQVLSAAEQGRRALQEKVSEWRDPQAFEKGYAEIMSGGSEYGFSPQEVGQVVDPRALLVLKDALAYRKLQAAKPETAKRISAAPKMVKPGVIKPAASKDAAIKALQDKVFKGQASVSDLLIARGSARARK